MKKLLFLLLIMIAFTGCSSDSNKTELANPGLKITAILSQNVISYRSDTYTNDYSGTTYDEPKPGYPMYYNNLGNVIDQQTGLLYSIQKILIWDYNYIRPRIDFTAHDGDIVMLEFITAGNTPLSGVVQYNGETIQVDNLSFEMNGGNRWYYYWITL